VKKILFYYPEIAEDKDSSLLYRGLPFSVMTLAAQFDPEQFQIKIIDGRLDNINNNGIWEWLDEHVVCVGISAMTSYQIKNGLTFARKVKNHYPDMPVVWGGWHPSLMPMQTIMNELVDIVCIGQGEVTLPNLLEGLLEQRDLNDIPNLVYKTAEGKVVQTKIEFLKAFSDTKPIERAYPYVNMESYIQPLWGNKRVVGYESSRGCPWHCKFCSIHAVYHSQWNCLNPMRVVDGVEILKKIYSADAIHFFDNNFFVNSSRVREISNLLRERRLNLRWDGTSVVEQFVKFNDGYLDELRQSGFFRVIVGIESGDEDVLKRLNKRHTQAQVLELVEKCKRHNIMPSLSFMVGFPWNPEKDFYCTVGLIEKIKKILPETEILLFIFSPYLGTEMFETAVAYGMQFPQSLEEWVEYTYDKVNVPWISPNLFRKIDRYIQFFGTKQMPPSTEAFFKNQKF